METEPERDDDMRFPLHVTTDTIRNSIRNRLRGRSRYPFVLMLEPLYTCNLACIGCAVERHTGKLADRLPIEDCLRAAEISEAPVVSICGGEPTLYPELPELVAGLIARKRHIYLCTNALLLEEKVYGRIEPHKRLKRRHVWALECMSCGAEQTADMPAPQRLH